MLRKTIFTEMQSIRRILITVMLLTLAELINAQGDKKYIRQGNREYGKNNYSEAEISYRRAIDENRGYADAVFNIGDALYKQNKFDDAGKQFVDNHYLVEDKEKKSASLYNLGNSLLMANKIQESIEAYKGSLKLNPSNMEAKYNLAYAQDLLKQQQQKNQEQQEQNKDQNKDQNNKQESKEQNQEKKQDQQQQQEQRQEISKEDAQRLLDALANDEKNVQEKVKLAKAMKARVRTLKNW